MNDLKMNMMKLASVVSILLITSVSSFAQSIEFTKENFKEQKDALKIAKDNIAQGDSYFEQGLIFYKQAIEPYLAANKFNPNNATLNYKLGQCYLFSNFKLKAIPHLEQAMKLDPSIDPFLYYFLGRAYQLDMQWDKAVKQYTSFQSKVSGAENAEYVQEVQLHMM